MDEIFHLDVLPLWLIFIATLLLSMLSAEAGGWLARASGPGKNGKEPEASLSAMTGAMLGLLAFIIAFTFGMTAARFEARKQLVLEESMATTTTFLRAGLMPAPYGDHVRQLLRNYAKTRLAATRQNMDETVKISEDIHQQLWAQATELANVKVDSELRSLFVNSLNALIDLHQNRKTVAFIHRIPMAIWLTVYVLLALSMLATGYQIGVAGFRRLLATPVMALGFSLVILLIADLDRPTEGFLQVNQQSIADALRMMQRSAE